MKLRTTLLLAICALFVLPAFAKGGIHPTQGLEVRKIQYYKKDRVVPEGVTLPSGQRNHGSDWIWVVTSSGVTRPIEDWTPFLNPSTTGRSEKLNIKNGFLVEPYDVLGGTDNTHVMTYSGVYTIDNEGYTCEGGRHQIGMTIECDEFGDVVLTTDLAGWHPNQKAWSGAIFPWAMMRVRAENIWGEESDDIVPVIELLGVEGYQDLTYNDDNTVFEFDPFPVDGNPHTLFATNDVFSGHPTAAMRITFVNSGKYGNNIELYSVGLLSHQMTDQVKDGLLTREYEVGSTYTLPWYNYDIGGRGVAYNDRHYKLQSQTDFGFNRPYRADGDSIQVIAVYDQNTQTFEDGRTYYQIGNYMLPNNGWYTSQYEQMFLRTPAHFGEARTITADEAADWFGAWADYTFSVPEDCEANINIATFANFNDARIITKGWGANGGNYPVEGQGSGVWIKKYAQAYVLELDGKPLKTNQTSYPEIIHDSAVYYGGHSGDINWDDVAYTSDQFFNEVLTDKTKWRSTLINGEANDTLWTWPYDKNNAYKTNVPKLADSSLGDQYVNVKLTAGTHTLRLKKLVPINNGFRGITFDIHEKTSQWGAQMGDVNGDGIVDVADVVALANYVMGETPEGFNVDVSNINGDEIIDVSDVVALANIVMGAGE